MLVAHLPGACGHWHRFAGRTSLAWDGYQRNKDATDPADAMLNYMYRIAEIEAVHACHAFGLSPQLGILHADKPGRDSMALDLIEAIRPRADRIVLGMLDTGTGVPYNSDGKPRYLDRRWFTETRDGRCRLVPPLTHQLASHAADLGAAIRPHAESATRILAMAASGEVSVRAPGSVRLLSLCPVIARAAFPMASPQMTCCPMVCGPKSGSLFRNLQLGLTASAVAGRSIRGRIVLLWRRSRHTSF
jgi:hypothetical protein